MFLLNIAVHFAAYLLAVNRLCFVHILSILPFCLFNLFLAGDGVGKLDFCLMFVPLLRPGNQTVTLSSDKQPVYI